MGLWRLSGGCWSVLGVVEGVETPEVHSTQVQYRLDDFSADVASSLTTISARFGRRRSRISR